ncbi:ion transporter [Aequorivita sp. H23M31]|uniref:Ion transporter n=1 Tax=Aequorivita ciconiae TaxID=2494375 RepID=A0A410G357_9FLAO|nr:ion transporter [Aequorivita sp. H23M31]QAA81712.1 ion transporter [Aequorivita sp. H23M31]
MAKQRHFIEKLRDLFLNEFFILGLIIINALIIFIDEFDLGYKTIGYLEASMTMLFIIEIWIKISHWGFRKYFSSNWNRLDFILIVVSLPSLLILFDNGAIMETNILLSLRILRVFKTFRLIRFMPEVDSFMKSIKRALQASYIIVLGFFILLFITALISCSLYKEIAPEYFRNPVVSIYSVFQLFSIEGWYEIPNLIAERSNEATAFFAKFYFSALLLGGGILGLSLVNSIFVDAMVSDNTDELEEDVKRLTQKIHSLEKKIDQLLKKSDDT